MVATINMVGLDLLLGHVLGCDRSIIVVSSSVSSAMSDHPLTCMAAMSTATSYTVHP